ncbi:MAG: hypothetical protein IPJ68_05530 [Candidatus Moraniibacteriota bacterium]|nr:MAG: hypothetical protein IPJ68_05530 [Candidatus Moranbacteria bacterium]
MKNSESAFRWIIGILKRHEVPFVVLGGLAAQAYGSKRDLNDIDLVIHRADFEKILPEVRTYVTYGPEMSRDEEAEGYAMELRYAEQDIDIGAEEGCKVLNRATGKFQLLETDFNDVETKEICGILVPVMRKEAVIAEKLKFNRPQDQEDIRQMQ